MVFIGPSIGPAQQHRSAEQEEHHDRLNSHSKTSTSSVQLSATWQRSQAIGCGLANLGNSCYMNSALQCLAHLPPLGNLCLARLHTSHGCRLPSGTCTCCLVEAQIARMLAPSMAQRSADTPYGIHRGLGLLSKGFVKGRQEDAHELLRCLVDAMERDLLKNEGRYDPHKPAKNPNTLVNALFSGILQSQVRCLSCGHESNTYDPMMDLSLELAGCRSVEEALGRFTAVERLDGANKYRCDGCKQLVPAEKRMAIWDDPNILVVHLKRFDAAFGKITRDIVFSEHLDLNAYMASTSGGATSSAASKAQQQGRQQQQGQQQQQQQRRAMRRPGGSYVLHGVLIHEGLSANSGHYYAYVRDGTGKWHCMNDSSVYRVSEARVLDSQRGAYILFYVRTSMKTPELVPEHTEHDGPPSTPAATAARTASNGPLKRTASSTSSAGSEDGSPRKRARATATAAAASATPSAATYAAPIGPQLPPGRAEQLSAAGASGSWSGSGGSSGRASVPGVTRIGLPPRQGSNLTGKSRLVPLAASATARQSQQQQQQQQQQQRATATGATAGSEAMDHTHANGNGAGRGTSSDAADNQTANGHVANGPGSHSHVYGQQQQGPANGTHQHPGDSTSGPGGTSNGTRSSNGSGSCSWEALKSQLMQGLQGTHFLQAMRRVVAQAAARGLSQDQVLASKEELRKQLLQDARMPAEILTMGKDGVFQHLLAQEQAAGAVQ